MSHHNTAIGAMVAATLTASVFAVTTPSGAAAPEDHVTRFALDLIDQTQLGDSFASSQELRRDGKVVGYESDTGRYEPKRGRTVIRVAIALKKGVIMGTVVGQSDQTGDKFYYRGPIQSGNGRFAGVTGRIVRVEDPASRTHMKLLWHIAQ
jgi:hypothetical protein